jgi:hypothetical protein
VIKTCSSKKGSLDIAYLSSLNDSWTEWNTPEDEMAYSDLQELFPEKIKKLLS